MSNQDVIRAWKDEEYRENLNATQRSRLPESPAGLVEVTDADLGSVAGGYTSYVCLGVGVYALCCRSFSGTCAGRPYSKGCC